MCIRDRLCSVGSFDRYSTPNLNPYCTLRSCSTPAVSSSPQSLDPRKAFHALRGWMFCGGRGGDCSFREPRSQLEPFSECLWDAIQCLSTRAVPSPPQSLDPRKACYALRGWMYCRGGTVQKCIARVWYTAQVDVDTVQCRELRSLLET